MLKISSFGLELWEKKHLVRLHSHRIRQFLRRQHATPCFERAAHNRLVCVGSVKLAELDRVSFNAYANHHVD